MCTELQSPIKVTSVTCEAINAAVNGTRKKPRVPNFVFNFSVCSASALIQFTFALDKRDLHIDLLTSGTYFLFNSNTLTYSSPSLLNTILKLNNDRATKLLS